MYGGYAPFPKRFGGGRPRLQVVHDSLNASRGTAVDASNSSTIAWVENMAYARAIVFDGYETNDRLALQRDPLRTTDFLSRWEGILKITPSPTATKYERRQVLFKRRQRFLDAAALHSILVAKLKDAIPHTFTAIEYISIENAVVHPPNECYPWGTVVLGFPWYSTVAHILVLLTKPAGYTEADFYADAAKVVPTLDGIIPSWATLDWYRKPASGAPIDLSPDGPSQAGFYLDNEHNLDNNVFADSYVDPAFLDLTAWLELGPCLGYSIA